MKDEVTFDRHKRNYGVIMICWACVGDPYPKMSGEQFYLIHFIIPRIASQIFILICWLFSIQIAKTGHPRIKEEHW